MESGESPTGDSRLLGGSMNDLAVLAVEVTDAEAAVVVLAQGDQWLVEGQHGLTEGVVDPLLQICRGLSPS
ncbi:MAG: hypothetical protein ACKO3H_14350, partial [Verrucomicrobiota bacterium]